MILRDIANSIYKCVQFTVDFPTNYEDKKVPVLDLKLYVKDLQVVHEFYEKPCAAKLVIPFKSAHSRGMKMSVLVEEGLRRLRNNSQGMEWEKSRIVMENWCQKLRRSGYPETIRHEVIKTACEKFDKMCEEEKNGGRPVHRPRGWRERERRKEKELKAVNWHKNQKNQVSAPLILDPTATSMTKEMKMVCNNFEKVTGMRIVVQERADIKISLWPNLNP